ncbi:MAG TPA: energy transducer TonB [Gemmatimonadota bacterium]|nr:energy transducer TonB [Gemmatimonadota bacterium]
MREAPDRRAGWWPALAAGLLVSVAVHAVLLGAVRFGGPDAADAARQHWYYLETPARVPLPPAPPPIPRPPPPEVPAAIEARAPDARIEPDSPDTVVLPEPPRVLSTPEDRPSFVYTDVPPLLERSREVQAALGRYYPDALRREGVEGRVGLELLIGENGRVREVRVMSSSGNSRLDRAGVTVAHHINYLPALNRDRTVAVWVRQVICFVVLRRRERKAPDCPVRVPGDDRRALRTGGS